jgi:hypothetical protein
VKLAFEVSFLDREDKQLLGRLRGELSGIAARCLAAYHRARERQRLIQPRSALALEDKIRKSSDPNAQFMQETFIADPAGTVSCGVVFRVFKEWCQRNGREELLTSVTKSNIRNGDQQSGWVRRCSPIIQAKGTTPALFPHAPAKTGRAGRGGRRLMRLWHFCASSLNGTARTAWSRLNA